MGLFCPGKILGFSGRVVTWLYTFVDMALYPVLVADYAKYFFPDLTGWQRWAVTWLVIFSSLTVNWRGALSVGRSAIHCFVAVTVPFLLFSILGAPHVNKAPWIPLIPDDQGLGQSMGVGMAVVMWNYLGWDNVSTFAGEVQKPKSNYPLAMMISVLLVTVLYLLPIGVGLGATDNWREWQNGSFPQVAAQVVGPWLVAVMSLGVMLSVWSLFRYIKDSLGIFFV